MPVAFVTGCTTGLGVAIAERLARDGYDLVLTARDTARLEWVRQHDAFEGRDVLLQELKLPDAQSIASAVGAAFDHFGRLDALINNAGLTVRESALETTEAQWDDIFGANLKGAFFLTQAVAKRVIAAKQPFRIVSLASTHGIVAFPNRIVYGTSKAALIHMSKNLAAEWAPFGITVNVVAPGTVTTPSRLEYMSRPEVRDMLLARVPAGRLGEADEVAGAVSYLLGPDAGFITGHVLVLDGGTTIV